MAALALVVGSASGATTRFLVEVFGSSAQPTFPADRGMAYDQGSEELYVIDSTEGELRRYNADGTASAFGALGSNAIDGEGTGDETPQAGLSFSSNDEREQVAIDESGEATDGNLYVTQSLSDVVDIFNSEGEYLGQLTESTAGGAFGEPCGVAVDAEGTVYVGDRGDDLIHVYDPAAAVPVDGDNTASHATVSNPCSLAAGTGATEGFLFANQSTGSAQKVDAASGEVKYEIASSVNTLSVDPGTGHVFVARNCCASSAVEEYDASGAAEASLVSSFKPGSTVEGVAINSAEERVYVARSSTEEVEVFGAPLIIPDVTTEAPSSNTGTRATLAGTVNPDGVELDECFFEWGRATFQGGEGIAENTTPCAETPAEIGSGTSPVAVHLDVSGLKPQVGTYQYRLRAANPNATIDGSNQQFDTPKTVFTEAASAITSTEATLNGTVNPDTATISECVFEVGPVKAPGESIQTYTETLPCVPGPGAITGESPVAVSANLSGLHAGTTYHYRLKATYPTGVELGADTTVQTKGPVILASWSQDVVVDDATLKAEIDPEGKATTYRFEYGTTEAYGSETPELAVGSDSSVHELTRLLEGLKEDTTYHYRVIATNADAENVGPDQTFTTYERFNPNTDCPNQAFRYGESANLPDCRAYEMVSPVEKNGGDIRASGVTPSNGTRGAFDKAAVGGDAITYTSATAFGDQPSNHKANQYLSRRGPAGWETHGISPPQLDSVLTNFGRVSFWGFSEQYRFFTEDLSVGWLKDHSKTLPVAGAAPGFANIYRRDNTTGAYSDPIITSEPLFWVEHSSGPVLDMAEAVVGASEDGETVVFPADAQLTPDAAPASSGSPADTKQIYKYSEGELQVVSVLPGGAPDKGATVGTKYVNDGASETGGVGGIRTERAVSKDASRVFWTDQVGQKGHVYVRIGDTKTVAVSESVTPGPAGFVTASTDGAKAIFSFEPGGPGPETDDLYEFDVDSEEPTFIAGELAGVAGGDDDLSHLYFLSREALEGEAVAGEPNLYLRRGGANEYVTTLAESDINRALSSAPRIDGPSPRNHGVRITSDGRYIVFNSNRSLTGYDNTDVITGEPVTEAYRYDAEEDELLCISCRPSGARPRGVRMREAYAVPAPDSGGTTNWRGAAWIMPSEHDLNSSRVLSEDGNRVFFNAIDALVPQDTNGRLDVYQWEAQGTGSCERPEGCIDLISTGRSDTFSEFVDASGDGDRVFIRTASSLHPDDPGLFDIYSASVGGGYPPPPPPPPPCVGDGCQAVPEAPLVPSPASAGFRGAGDPVPTRNCAAAAKRAVKLSRRAKRMRRAARRSRSTARSKRLHRRSAGFAKRAKRISRNAKRCRRANRRAAR